MSISINNITFTIFLFASTSVFGYSQDTGNVSRIYVTPGGSIAFKLQGGFPNAVETSQCLNNNGWAGHFTADPVLKSAILTAKATGYSIIVTLEGCEGRWFKVKDIYIK